MAPYIKILKQYGINEVNLELMPPENIETVLENTKKDGVTSIQFNLEVWDKEKRKEIMPYKGEIPREDYISAISKASRIFGKGKVTSVILAGLNSETEIREAAYEVLNANGIPSLEIYRSIKGTPFKKFSSNFNISSIKQLSDEINDLIKEKYTTSITNKLEGCYKCKGCTLLK